MLRRRKGARSTLGTLQNQFKETERALSALKLFNTRHFEALSPAEQRGSISQTSKHAHALYDCEKQHNGFNPTGKKRPEWNSQ